jgi:cobalt-zinc-cadmium efflux system membrane fusion protein
MTLRCLLRLVLWVLLALGCDRSRSDDVAPGKAERAAPPEHRDEPEHEELPRRVRLPDKVVAAAKIQTAVVRKEVLAITLALPGEIAVDPDKHARVSSPIAGQLSMVAFREGSAVKRGELLARVRIPDLGRLRAEHATASSKARVARGNSARLEELAAKGLAARQEALDARAAAEGLEAEARATEEQLRLLGSASGGSSELALRAPISGIVISRAAVVGQPVRSEDIIADIADLSEVLFLGRVFEKDLDSVHTGAAAEVELNAFPRRRFPGAVEYVARQIDPVARTLTARIRLSNPDGLLRLGLFGTAHIASGNEQSEPVLAIARSAVTEISGKPVVFVQQPDGDYELHEVSLGESNLGRIRVLSGLREGEAVVVDGVFTLKSSVLRDSLAEEE